MLAKILGLIGILTGILWFVKPEALKNRLKKKINRKLKLSVYAFVIIFGFLIIGSAVKTEGILSKVVGIIGMIIAIKGILLLTSKTSEKMLDWVADRPVGFFRIWALVVLALGVMLVLA